MVNRRQFMTLAAGVAFVGPRLAATVTIKPEISERRGFADFDLDGNGVWKVSGRTLVLEKPGVPGGPIRRPAALAIVKSPPLTDVRLSVEMRSTAPVDLAVRDVQVIFGYQSPSQFYYVHLAAKTDGVHNGIFLVNNADRRRLDDLSSRARFVDQAWHRVRLERNDATGAVAVFIDDDKTPALSTTDRTLTWGRVGVGSFDETGEFRAIEVTGTPKA